MIVLKAKQPPGPGGCFMLMMRLLFQKLVEKLAE